MKADFPFEVLARRVSRSERRHRSVLQVKRILSLPGRRVIVLARFKDRVAS